MSAAIELGKDTPLMVPKSPKRGFASLTAIRATFVRATTRPKGQLQCHFGKITLKKYQRFLCIKFIKRFGAIRHLVNKKPLPSARLPTV